MTPQNNFSRRQFLQVVACAGLVGLSYKFGLDQLVPAAPEKVTDTRFLMGTVLNLQVIGPVEQARKAIDACFERMTALEAVLSIFKPDSQISQLNRYGVVGQVHPFMEDVLKQAMHLGQLTGGAFDISIKPVLDLYKLNPGSLPTTRQIESALALVDYRKIELDQISRTITFQKPGMSITLDGIAKGFIVDEGVAVLKSLGFDNVMVEAGGDLLGLGKKDPGSPWKIGLQKPRAEMGDLSVIFDIYNRAIATSGDYMQSFTPDFVNHHIINPHTGHSSPELASVTVLAPTVALADGLATAVMVMGKSGLDLVESLANCEAYAIEKNLTVIKTSGIGSILE